ncbi:Sin3 family co-repressor-domain-containing protein [Blakeslea trispora]|nr:Sin3 family co-repressor-domain-containing protein [Blakeslea trispora]
MTSENIPDTRAPNISYSIAPSAPSTLEQRPLNVKDALSYLDKVKAKFTTQADVYSQFLDIMKDFKSQTIDTPGVIERVSALFQGHPTLMSGFNTFLPPGYCIECSSDAQDQQIITVTTPLGVTRIKDTETLILSSPTSNDTQSTSNIQASQLSKKSFKSPIEFNQAITYVNKIKSRFANRPETYKKFLEILQTYQKDQKPIEQVYAEVKELFDGSEELLEEFKQFLPDPNKQRNKKRLGNIANLGISKRTKHHHGNNELQTSDIRSQEGDTARPTFSAEEAEFFEQVKAYIGNKATYNAFLKVLNLFSQQIVDQNVLVNRVESFIGGNKQLFDWFKELVGYDQEQGSVSSRPTQQLPSTASLPDNDINSCGPSYRYVPKTWQNQSSCSGRDALCWDVLNDTYISHPTWASEDTGFVAAKKNQYEEALHRVEEERYDYDLNIESNLNTIALLEPVAKKIAAMTPEEKSGFRLESGLGGATSATIYQRIIKKIYGPQKGIEMIDLLHTNPAQSVPIVLKRLRQKDDEWKRAQREWNKIWREVETKNYWKSLDHQSILFKQNDRKVMANRSLISQAELQRVSGKPFDFGFVDPAIFKDISRFVYFHLDRQPVYNPEDCDAMRDFMNTIVPSLLDTNDVEPSAIDTDMVMEDIVDDDASSVQSANSRTPPTTNTGRGGKGGRGTRGRRQHQRRAANVGRKARAANVAQPDDEGLLKDVLKRNMNSSKKKQNSDDEDDGDHQDEEDEDEEEDEETEDREEEQSSRQQSDQENDADQDDDEDEDEEDEDAEEEIDEEEREAQEEEEEAVPETARRTGRPRRRAAAAAAAATATSRIKKKNKQQRIKTKKSVPKLASFIDPLSPEESQKTYHFYGDNNFYCFLRLYQALYERLEKMKILDAEFKRDPRKSFSAHEEARILGIAPKRFKALKVNTKGGSYQILLSLIDRLVEGDLDQQTFEEYVRYIFGPDAYIIFTIDKLVLSIVRQVKIE